MRSLIKRAGAGAAATVTAIVMAVAAIGALPAAAQEGETFKIGVVTFLSGQAAQSFGVPAWNGGKMLVEKLNAGEAPAPYDQKGFGGMKIEPVVIDEAGGATTQVQEFRNLVQREGVDAVVGYVSSGDCLAIAPVAEELKQFTILYDCGTPRIFEEADYDYVFRTAAHATQDNVGLARYLKAQGVEVDTFSGINQDYAWGHDSWADFKAAMGQIYPDAKVTAELFPAFGAGPVRHRDLGPDAGRRRRGALLALGRRPAGADAAGAAARALPAEPGRLLGRRPRAAADGQQHARGRDHRRPRRLWLHGARERPEHMVVGQLHGDRTTSSRSRRPTAWRRRCWA